MKKNTQKSGLLRLTRSSGAADSPLEAAERLAEMLPWDTGTLTEAELAAALSLMETLTKWAEHTRESARNVILSGKAIPGWKVVETVTHRKFTNPDAAFAALRECGVPEASLYERRPRSLARIEKLVGKETFRRAAPYVERPQGQPVLVRESDRRTPYPLA